MSLKAVTVCCDWPDCVAEVSVGSYPAALRDRNWQSQRGPLVGPHLCPEHRFKTWAELDEARYGTHPAE